MLTVACVFHATDSDNSMGGYYNASWVHKLKRNVALHLSEKHQFVCLTNTRIEGVRCVPLKHPWWEGWWSKIELFEPGRFHGPVLYLDLDLFATSSLDDFVVPRQNLVMLRDHLDHVKNSSIMYWDGRDKRIHQIFHTFKADPEGAKSRHEHVDSLGDQGFITETLEKQGYTIDLWQDLLGSEGFLPFSFGRMLNLELRGGLLPENTRVVYCLGPPKFHQFEDLSFVKTHWSQVDKVVPLEKISMW